MSDYRDQEFNRPDAEFRALPKEFQQTPEINPVVKVKSSKKSLTNKVKMLFYFISATVVLGSYVVSGAILGDAYREDTIGFGAEEHITPGGTGTTATPTPTGTVIKPGDGDTIAGSALRFEWNYNPFSEPLSADYYRMTGEIIINGSSETYDSNDEGVDNFRDDAERFADFIKAGYELQQSNFFIEHRSQSLHTFLEDGSLGENMDVTSWFPSSFDFKINDMELTIDITRVRAYILCDWDVSADHKISETVEVEGHYYYAAGLQYFIDGEITLAAKEPPTDIADEGDKLYISRTYNEFQSNYSDQYYSNIITRIIENGNTVNYVVYRDAVEDGCADLQAAGTTLAGYLDGDYVLEWFENNKDASTRFDVGIGDKKPNFDVTDWFPKEFEYSVHGHNMKVTITRVSGYIVTLSISKERVDKGEVTIHSGAYYSDGEYSYRYPAGVEFEIRGTFTQLD